MHFIVNPRSLRGKNKNLLESIENKLQETAREYEIHRTVNKGDATAYARELTQKGETTLVAIGGDGMLNDVLSGICDPSRCTLGLIPAGTGNDFAATAKIPHGEEALDLILQSEPKPTDFLQFDDGKRSMNIAGQGIDVDILLRCERMKLLKGKSKYFFSLIATIFRYRGLPVNIEVDGQAWQTNAMIVAACNGKMLGGGIPLCPPAEIDDGKMELVVVDQPKRRKLFGALIKLMKGKLFSLPFAHRITCERAVFTPLQPATAQFDGELYEVDSMGVTLVSNRLKMFRG